MEDITYIRNEYFRIFSHTGDIHIETFKRGFPLGELHHIVQSFPQIDITNMQVAMWALNSAPRPPERIGRQKDRITLEFTNNNLQAIVTYNLPSEELVFENRDNLTKETIARLKETGIVYGVKKELFFSELLSSKPYAIAEGIAPIDGQDSVIKMYELKEAIPKIHGDGKVDFYELKLINLVCADEWLGERIHATAGIAGYSVKGETIKAVNGRNFPLNYDKNTVREEVSVDKTTLYSRINGAVNYTDGKISISNHLEIEGDVDFRTGNIKFDGYLTVKGSVTDGFTVEATRDIEINGDLGLGNVKEILSTKGSIYVKGGISSKGKSEIKAAGNIYLKFADNASIVCGDTLHIGYYCINSTVSAGMMIIDSAQGQIIGGVTRVAFGVTAPILGSEIEKRTVIEVEGFDRNSLKEELDTTFQKISELKSEQQKVKNTLLSYENKGILDPFMQKAYNDCFSRLAEIRDTICILEDKRKNIVNSLKVRGEGEIRVTKKIFPNCLFIIKQKKMEFFDASPPASLFFQDHEIKIL